MPRYDMDADFIDNIEVSDSIGHEYVAYFEVSGYHKLQIIIITFEDIEVGGKKRLKVITVST